MLLPEVLPLVAAYTFLVSRDNQRLIVKAVKSNYDWYSLNQLPYLSNFASIVEKIDQTLIFDDVLVSVEKHLFKNGLFKNVITNSMNFETFTAVKSDDLNSICETIPELERKSLIEEAYQIIKYSQRFPNYMIDIFDITKDDPKEWIRRVDFALQLVNAKPDTFGKIVLGLLLYKPEWTWLIQQLKEDAEIPWRTLSNKFVIEFSKKQTKMWNLFNFDVDENNQDLETQINLKMQIWSKEVAAVSKNQLRLFILKGFARYESNELDSDYSECSDFEFVRACRMEYENKVLNINLSGKDGLRGFMTIKSSFEESHIKFNELIVEPSEWITNFEQVYQSETITNGKNVLAFFFDYTNMKWLKEIVTAEPLIEWNSLKAKFIEHFTQLREFKKNSLLSTYKEGNVIDFVIFQTQLWSIQVPGIEEKALNQLVLHKLPENSHKPLQQCAKSSTLEFLACCRLAFQAEFSGSLECL